MQQMSSILMLETHRTLVLTVFCSPHPRHFHVASSSCSDSTPIPIYTQNRVTFKDFALQAGLANIKK